MYYLHDLPAINYTTDALILLLHVYYVYKHVLSPRSTSYQLHHKCANFATIICI